MNEAARRTLNVGPRTHDGGWVTTLIATNGTSMVMPPVGSWVQARDLAQVLHCEMFYIYPDALTEMIDAGVGPRRPDQDQLS